MEITDVKIDKQTNDEKKLEPYIKLMKKYGVSNPIKLLPRAPRYHVSFKLKNTCSSMANAVRRVFIEELRTKCLHFEDNDLTTNDEFILVDVMQKNIQLLPIEQEGKNYAGKSISLYKYNDTNDIIDVKASDMSISEKSSKSKSGKNKESQPNKSTMRIEELIPDPNITIIRLRPGKFIKITDMQFLEGYAKDDAGKFSLLDNVTYDILGVTPYDSFKHTGKRSIEYDPEQFAISFTTCGNITPKEVINRLSETLIDKLIRAKKYIQDYAKSDQTSNYYYTEGFEATISDEVVSYKFYGEYITLSNMLAQRCYLLDRTILFCAPTVERLDNEIAIVRLKHADTNKLLLSAIDECIKDVNTISKQFK